MVDGVLHSASIRIPVVQLQPVYDPIQYHIGFLYSHEQEPWAPFRMSLMFVHGQESAC